MSKVTSIKAAMTDIRVGLKEYYADVETVTIYNKSITFGYSVNNGFIAETTLSGGSGFKFTRASGYFCATTETYDTFEEASKVARKLRKYDVKSFVTLLSRNTYKVYISGESTLDGAKKDVKKVKDSGFLFDKPTKDNGHRIKVTYSEGEFLIDGKVYGMYPQWKAAKKEGGAKVVNLGNRKYRGRIEIGRYGNKKLTCVSVINIEAYLLSVVPCEMVSSWPMEALKAQAVVARTYCLAECGYGTDSDIKNPYKIVDTTESQVYKGYAYETKRTTEAVSKTEGKLVRYNGEIIPTYFFSTSGGATENANDIWTSQLQCYTSVPDIYELQPEKKPWILKTTYEDVMERLSNYGIELPSVPTRLYSKIKTSSLRTKVMAVKCGTETVLVEKGAVRSSLGIPSTKIKFITKGSIPDNVYIKAAGKSVKEKRISDCYIISGGDTITKATDTTYEQYIAMSTSNMSNYPKVKPSKKSDIYIAGMGYGHGVGLSQSGAMGMANQGFNYRQIVEYYFNGAVCE